MNQRFNSVPRLKITTSLQVEQNSIGNSPTIFHTPRRLVTESNKQNYFHKLSYQDQWKSERLIKYVKHKIIDKGINKKQGFQDIFLINNFKVYKYYIPLYSKIENENELISDFIEQSMHLKTLLNLKSTPKIWTLEGIQIKNFHLPKQKVFYINNSFDFWNMIAHYNQFHGSFQMNLLESLYDDISQFKNSSQIFDYFFSDISKIKNYFASQINKLPYIQNTQSKIDLNDHEIETAFAMLDTEKQKTKVQIYEQLNKEMNSKSNYSQKSNKLIRLNIKTRTRQSIEQQILQENITNPEDLQQQIQEQVECSNLFIPSTQNIEISQVNNPFQLKTNLNDRYFMKNVNIDKIQMDYKITRRQTINFLTIFKCLLNREPQPSKLLISKANLLLAYPYLMMEGQSCGYDTFLFIKETKMSRFSFEEFVKIFIQGKA
ncbi:unnamed protein product [Paramecium primaurelia]|uniref:Uncharacterized protein n=1 Tax=Paramecium primaurelia TaxID=5886 RepID=A0A8S1PLG7_PARPR|nr:unnamed protein product [Paramecium primaurelia]